ncbi:prohibitin family protein [Xanthobacteraceae bacterium A53D]
MSILSDALGFGRRSLNVADDLDEWDAEEEAAYRRARAARRRRSYFTLGLIAALLLVVVLWSRMVVSIKSGEAGVQYRFFFGTEMDRIYGEGLHIIWPWNRMFIYVTRLQNEERKYQLLTKDGLPVNISVAIRYQPDVRFLPLLHVTVGPQYADTIVFPETEAVLRRTLGQYEPEEVYTSARGFLEALVVGSLSNVETRYVIVDNVLVRSVELPEPVRAAIEKKVALGEERKAYDARIGIEQREAERKAIEARGIQTYQQIVNESLTPEILRWQGILATKELATSTNAKTVVVPSGNGGVPFILGADR